jgi:hypothetical protein
MKTNIGLLTRRVMPTLLGMALFGGISALPALAQSDQDTDIKANELTPPVPQPAQPTQQTDPSAPQTDQAAPQSANLYIFDVPAAMLDFSLDDAVFSSTAPDRDVVLWPSQENIDNGSGYIYLLRGNTLYQENVNTLAVVNETTLPDLANNDIGAMDSANDNASRRMRMHRRLRMHRNYDVQTMMTDTGLLPAATMTTNGGYLYMVRGDALYKFDTEGLTLVKQTELPGQAESIQPNNSMPDSNQNDQNEINQNEINNDRLDETHPDNINPGQGTDDNSTNGTNDDNSIDQAR